MENSNSAQQNQSMEWPGNAGTQKSKKRVKIFYLLLAVFLVIGSAFGSFYFSQNLNQASVPNAPESQPQAAAGKNQKTNNTEAEGCAKGCGSNEYCDAGRCKPIGGRDDGRSDGEKAWDSVVIATPTPKGETSTTNKGYEAIPGYKCTAANCNSGFRCLNENTCINIANPNLSVANDPENCGGTTTTESDHRCQIGQACIGGTCRRPETYNTCDANNCDLSRSHCIKDSAGYGRCVPIGVTSIAPTKFNVITPLPTPTKLPLSKDPNNCGAVGRVCPVGKQKCVDGVCVNDGGTVSCEGILADDGTHPDPSKSTSGQARFRTCCVPGGLGVDPNQLNEKGMVDVDMRVHWTNCAEGTTCVQGKGCFGTTTKTPGTTTTTTTTTVTVPPTITTTTTPSITTTVTITPTDTPTGTITVTPTPVSCNESCTEDSDCVSGLYCDATSKKCRKSECSTETSCVCPTGTPEPTIVGCNKGCESDSNCMEGLVCDSNSGRCRRPSCMSSSDCRCQREITTTRRPTERETIAATRRPTTRQQETLTEAGILDLPGAITFGGGLILAIVGILLAL